MKQVSSYIIDLLHDHECVIVSGLGGFLLKNKPAKQSVDGKTLLPPSSEISFSPALKQADFLLSSAIVEQESCSVSEAEQKIEEFIQEVSQSLIDTKSYVIPQIGKLYLDEEEQLQFKPYPFVNFNKNSFGLVPIAIEKLDRQKIDKQEVKRYASKNPYRFTAAASLLLFALAASLFYVNQSSTENYVSFDFVRSVFSFDKDQKHSTIPEIKKPGSIESVQLIDTNNSNPFADDYTEANDPFHASNQSELEPKEIATYNHVKEEPNLTKNTNQNPANFHIVIGMFSEEHNANTIKRIAEKKGYSPIIKRGQKYYRVLIPFTYEQATMREAQQEVSRSVVQGAWVWELR